MDKILIEIIFSIFLFFFIVLLIISDNKKIKILAESFKPLHIKIYFILTILFYLFIIYGINNENLKIITIDKKEHLRLKNIANNSLFGLVIALFAHLKLFIFPFWFIFFLMYFNILNPKF